MRFFWYLREGILRGENLLNVGVKEDFDFAETNNGVVSGRGWRDAQAVRSLQSLIEARLAAGFAELDSQTGNVEVRRQLYADLVRNAIGMARQRLPDNPFLEDLIGAIISGADLPYRCTEKGPCEPAQAVMT